MLKLTEFIMGILQRLRDWAVTIEKMSFNDLPDLIVDSNNGQVLFATDDFFAVAGKWNMCLNRQKT